MKKLVGLSLIALLAGCSSGNGSGLASTPITTGGGVGVVTSGLPTVQRDAVGYTFDSRQLNTVQGAGAVSAIGVVPVSTTSLVAAAPLNEVFRAEAGGTPTEGAFFSPVSSFATLDFDAFAATADSRVASNGDVFIRNEISSTNFEWISILDTSYSEAVVAVAGSQVYAIAGGPAQSGQIYQYNSVDFASVATLGSHIPTAAADFKGDLLIGATFANATGGPASLHRLRSGLLQQIQLPGAAGGNGVRQEVTALLSITNANGLDFTLIVAVGSFDGNGNALGGYLLASNGSQFETMASYANDAPMGLAAIDDTVYVGLDSGKLQYRQDDGTWADEPNFPQVESITSLRTLDAATLAIGAQNGGAVLVLRYAGNTTVTPPQPPSTDVFYDPEVEAVLAARCYTCHVANAPNPAIAGNSMLLTGTDLNADYAVVNALTNNADPAQSTLVRKALGELGHGGSAILTNGSSELQTLIDWQTQGSRFEDAVTPPPPPPPSLSTFEADVKSILDADCSGCHAGRSGAGQFHYQGNAGTINMDWMETRDQTNAGQPAMSELLLRGGVGGSSSHPVRPLDNAEQQTIITWISDGRLLN